MSPIANSFLRRLFLFNGKVIDYDRDNPWKQIINANCMSGNLKCPGQRVGD